MPASPINITSRENIEANQKGQFSEEQSKVIAEDARSYLRPIAWVIGGALALLLTGALIMARGDLAVLISSALAAANVYICSAVIVGILLLVVWIGRASLRTQAKARDLAEANILTAEGEVTWRKNKYVACTDDRRRLKAPLDDWDLFDLDLLPGRYRFHYLGRVGWILSAQKLSGELANLLPLLERAFRFTQEDLKANQCGELTERQVKMIRRDVILGLYDDPFSHFSTIWAVMGLGGLVLVAFITYWPALIMIFLAVILILCVAGWRLLWLRNRPLSADLAGKRVEHVDGLRRVTTTKIVRDPKTGQRSEIRANWVYAPKLKRYFKPGRRGTGFKALVMQNGIDYRVYYTPRSGDLVSLEPIQARNQAAGAEGE